MHFYHEQANLLEGAAKLVDPVTAARRMQRVHDLRRRSYEDALDANVLIGTPDTIAEKLQGRCRREIGLSGILAELNCGGLIPHGTWSTRCGCCAKRSCRAFARSRSGVAPVTRLNQGKGDFRC